MSSCGVSVCPVGHRDEGEEFFTLGTKTRIIRGSVRSGSGLSPE